MTAVMVGALALPAMAIDVVLDGETVPLDQPPIMEGSRVLVPLRGVFEKMGATVRYDATTRTIRAERDGGAQHTIVELTLDSPAATVNGKQVQLDAPARSLYGRTVVPLRFVSEAMGATVVWEAGPQRVAITSAPEPAPTRPARPTPDETPPPHRTHQPPAMPDAAPSTAPSAVTAQPPLIRSLTHNGTALSADQMFEVRLEGTPGGHASFDLIGAAQHVAMREVSPGLYVGTLTLPAGSGALRDAPLIVRLEVGGIATKMQARQMVNVQPAMAAPRVDLQVSYPRPAQRVPTSFVVEGTTLPYARIEVRAAVQRQLIRGAVIATAQRVVFSGSADASGRFRVPVSLTPSASTDTLRLTVTASDAGSGARSQAVLLDLSF
jgi:hypothetical protein